MLTLNKLLTWRLKSNNWRMPRLLWRLTMKLKSLDLSLMKQTYPEESNKTLMISMLKSLTEVTKWLLILELESLPMLFSDCKHTVTLKLKDISTSMVLTSRRSTILPRLDKELSWSTMILLPPLSPRSTSAGNLPTKSLRSKTIRSTSGLDSKMRSSLPPLMTSVSSLAPPLLMTGSPLANLNLGAGFPSPSPLESTRASNSHSDLKPSSRLWSPNSDFRLPSEHDYEQ